MFKHLKELRLERKQKTRELECLYILTDHFDVNGMSEECDRNLEDLEHFLFGETEENIESEETENGKDTFLERKRSVLFSWEEVFCNCKKLNDCLWCFLLPIQYPHAMIFSQGFRSCSTLYSAL